MNKEWSSKRTEATPGSCVWSLKRMIFFLIRMNGTVVGITCYISMILSNRLVWLLDLRRASISKVLSNFFELVLPFYMPSVIMWEVANLVDVWAFHPPC